MITFGGTPNLSLYTRLQKQTRGQYKPIRHGKEEERKQTSKIFIFHDHKRKVDEALDYHQKSYPLMFAAVRFPAVARTEIQIQSMIQMVQLSLLRSNILKPFKTKIMQR